MGRTIWHPTEENTWAQLSILDKEELVVNVHPCPTLLTWLDTHSGPCSKDELVSAGIPSLQVRSLQ